MPGSVQGAGILQRTAVLMKIIPIMWNLHSAWGMKVINKTSKQSIKLDGDKCYEKNAERIDEKCQGVVRAEILNMTVNEDLKKEGYTWETSIIEKGGDHLGIEDLPRQRISKVRVEGCLRRHRTRN